MAVQFSLDLSPYTDIVSGYSYKVLEQLNSCEDWIEQAKIYYDYNQLFQHKYKTVVNDENGKIKLISERDPDVNFYHRLIIVDPPKTVESFFIQGVNHPIDRSQETFNSIISGDGLTYGWYLCTLLYATIGENLIGSLATCWGGITGCSSEHDGWQTRLEIFISAAERMGNQLDLEFLKLIKTTRVDKPNKSTVLNCIEFGKICCPDYETELIDSILLDPTKGELIEKIFHLSYRCYYEGNWIDHFWNTPIWFHRAMTLNCRTHLSIFVNNDSAFHASFLVKYLSPETADFFNTCLDEYEKQGGQQIQEAIEEFSAELEKGENLDFHKEQLNYYQKLSQEGPSCNMLKSLLRYHRPSEKKMNFVCQFIISSKYSPIPPVSDQSISPFDIVCDFRETLVDSEC